MLPYSHWYFFLCPPPPPFLPPFSSISWWNKNYWCSWMKKAQGRIHMINTIALHCHLESHIAPTHTHMHKRDQWCVTEDWTWWGQSAHFLHLIPHHPSHQSFCYLPYSPFPLTRYLCLILKRFLAPQSSSFLVLEPTAGDIWALWKVSSSCKDNSKVKLFSWLPLKYDMTSAYTG